MNKLKFLVAALLVAAMLFGCESSKSPANHNETQPEETTQPAPTRTEDKAPDFTMFDLNGKPVQLSDFQGKPVVVNFWATWCNPCTSELPEFQKAYEKWGKDVQFLMVDMTDGRDETVEKAQAFIDQQGYTFPVYFDSEKSAATTYMVQAIPCTYFIDAEGYLMGQHVGMISDDALEQGIEEICK